MESATQAAVGPWSPVDPSALEDEDSNLFLSDTFRMNCMKVLPCSKRYVHDWTECPFAHPQEKARRRDPRVHSYTGIACPSMKKEGLCAFGDHCPYAHNVFEYWLHPTRYRTQLCNDGSNCKRKICFFAHSLDELRVPACKPFVSPEALAAAAAAAAAGAEAKRAASTVGSPFLGGCSAPDTPSPASMAAGQQQQQQQLEAAAAASEAAAMRRISADYSAAAAAGALPSPVSVTASVGGGRGSADALSASLQALRGRGFSQQEQQVIELVTAMLSQDKLSASQAASILQAMLPAPTLALLQQHLLAPTTPGTADPAATSLRCHSDPLEASRAPSFDEAGMLRVSMPASLPGGGQLQQCAMLSAMQLAALQSQGLLPPSATHAFSATYPGASPRASFEAASSLRSSFDSLRPDPMDYGGSSMRGSMDVRSASLDYSRGGSLDYSRSGSLDVASPSMMHQVMQASAFYQQQRGGSQPLQQQRLSNNGSNGSQLAPVPENGLVAQALPPASEAIAQIAKKASQGDLASQMPMDAYAGPGAAAALASVAAQQQGPQAPQAAQQVELLPQSSEQGLREAHAAVTALALQHAQRRHSVDGAWQAMQQVQQQVQPSRHSSDRPHQMVGQLSSESLPYLANPMYAAAVAQQQAQRAQQQAQQQYVPAGMVANLSSDFHRMSMEDNVNRRPAPVVANAFASSFFAPSAPVASAGLVAPTPIRTYSVPESPTQGGLAVRCSPDPAAHDSPK